MLSLRKMTVLRLDLSPASGSFRLALPKEVSTMSTPRKLLLGGLAALSLLALPLTSAQAGVRIGIGVGVPVYRPYFRPYYRPYYRPYVAVGVGVPVYVAPPPVIVAPAPVYLSPGPAPVYVQPVAPPAPTYIQPPG